MSLQKPFKTAGRLEIVTNKKTATVMQRFFYTSSMSPLL
jgi:hypothetical protein